MLGNERFLSPASCQSQYGFRQTKMTTFFSAPQPLSPSYIDGVCHREWGKGAGWGRRQAAAAAPAPNHELAVLFMLMFTLTPDAQHLVCCQLLD